MSVTLAALDNGSQRPTDNLTFAQALGQTPGGSPSLGVVLSSLYNPSNYGNDVMSQTVTGKELEAFARWYYNSFVVPTTNSDLRYLFDTKFAAALLGLLHAKKTFNQPNYGTYPSSLYTQEIRPVTVYAQTGTKTETWIQNSVTAGWNASFWNIDLNTSNSGSGLGALNLQNHVEMMVFGFADFAASPKLFEAKFYENGTTPLGVKSHSLMFAKGNQNLVILDQAYSIIENQKYTADLNFSAAGESIPAVLGIQYVDQTYYQEE